MRSLLTAVSLFAGIGGVDLALQRSGVRVMAAVEIDPPARGVLADRFPHLALFEDVREVTGDQLVAAGFDPGRGIVAAGWPCQGNSVAGRRGGMDDPRSGLWTHVVRLLAETRARWFLGENVPGILSVRDGRDWATCLHDLARLGMGFAWRVVDAQHFGVPQRRRRVFIVGRAGGDPTGPIQVLLEPESGGRDSAPGRTAGPGAAVVTALRAGSGGGCGPDDNDAQGGRLIVGPLQAQGANGRGHRVDAKGAATGHLVAATLTAGSHAGPPPGRHREDDENVVLAPTLTAGMGSNVGHPGDAGKDAVVLAVAAALTSRQGIGQDFASGEDIAMPVTGSNGQPGVAAATAVRRLTARECERLQGLPDDWTSTSNGQPQSDSARYRQLGNSVAVPVVEWIARQLVATEGESAGG